MTAARRRRATRRPAPRATTRPLGPGRPRLGGAASPGGGAVGTGIGWLASLAGRARAGSARRAPPPRAARCALRLIGPLTGSARRTPSRRRARACRRSAGPRRRARGSRRGTPGTSRCSGSGPRPCWRCSARRRRRGRWRPAGGATSSLWATAASNSVDLLLVDAVPERGVDDDGDQASGYSSMNAITASLSWARLGMRPAFGRDVGSVDDHHVGGARPRCRHELCVRLIVRSPRSTRGAAPTNRRAASPPIVESPPVIRAVLWDFGGVILTSPFEAFRRYEQHGPADGFIRSVNATDPDTNVWARLERARSTTTTSTRRSPPSRRRSATRCPAPTCWPCWPATVRPEMVVALDARPGGRLPTACLTNNVVKRDDEPTAGGPRSRR